MRFRGGRLTGRAVPRNQAFVHSLTAVEEFAVDDMPLDPLKRPGRDEWLFAAALIAGGMVIAALSILEIRSGEWRQEIAQATQQLPSSSAPSKNEAPAESKPGGTRPTTPAPEPAPPGPDEAKKAGGRPVPPQRPAEKYGAPIKEPQAREK